MSKAIVVSIPHRLGLAEAKHRLEAGADRLVSQIGAAGHMECAWRGDTLLFSLLAIGETVTGAITAGENEVEVVVDMPGIFAMVARTARNRLRNEGRRMLADR